MQQASSQGASVSIGGSLLNDAILQRVEVRQRLNDHWYCEIECRGTYDRPIPGEDALGSACTLTIIGDDGSQHTIFSGILYDVALRQEVWGSYTAILRGVSMSWLIDHSERYAYFGTSSVNAMASQLGGLAGGASCALTDKSSPAEYVQYGETDWQFLLRLADDHKGWIRSGLGSLELRDSFDSPTPLIYRDHHGLLEFSVDGELRPGKIAASQYDSSQFISQAWPGQQKEPQYESQGARMGEAIGSGSASLNLVGYTSRSRSWSTDDMATRASSEAERSLGGGLRAGGVSRDQTLNAGGAIDVQNLNEANGVYYLLEVTHTWTTKEYINHFVATPWKNWRAATRFRPHAGRGVQVGRVIANHDPDQRGRLRVSLYWQEQGSLLWAPMISLHSGASFGFTVIPEIGDEVLVGFLDGDPERPVILGSLWNATHTPPRDQFATANESQDNLVKRIVTKSGIRIHMVDTPGHESISLATPRSNNLLLSEKVAETGRPAVSLNTLGDIHLHAAGRIHYQSATHSHHVDGKIMHSAAISIADIFGNTGSFETTEIHATLSDGSSFQGPVAAGQAFHKLPPGTNTFQAPQFYVERPPDAEDEA
jgi:type VI secretion system secreted protein VgrG